MEDPIEFESNDQHTQFIKGKRSKRQRPALSPHDDSTDHSTTSLTTSFSSSSTYDGQEGQNGYFSSSTTSTEMLCSTTSTEEEQEEEEEEEDMANCLILLAQGGSLKKTKQGTHTSTSLCVYECKTCNRTFSSFQALGGHRASHKKQPKARPTILVEENKIPKIPFLAEEPEKVSFRKNSHNPSHGLSFHEASIKKLKVHECSICGCEFTSGQALGGHMRRHRVSSNVVVDINKSTNISVHNKHNNVMENQRNMLQLDLNLPAPEDDPRDSQFQFVANHQVFSGPTLVECHY